jgi:hypothetical protein
MKIKGLAGANAMLRDISKMVGVDGGAALYYPQERRSNKHQKKAPSFEQLLGYLAEDGRDIRPNDEDVKKMGEIIVEHIGKHLRRVGRTVDDPRTGKKIRIRKEKQSLAGFVGGTRAAMMFARKRMLQRIKTGSTNRGKAATVTPNYARQRLRDYGVNESVVYVASGQLANAMSGAQVKVNIKSKS